MAYITLNIEELERMQTSGAYELNIKIDADWLKSAIEGRRRPVELWQRLT